jgi:hypothetical protein
MTTPDWLIHQYHQEERIEETDQDQQYCRVTDQEARGEYYSSTPDIFTKPLAEDKFYTFQKQMYGHEPEQAEAKDDGPALENTWMQGQISRERRKFSNWCSSTVNWASHTCRPRSGQHERTGNGERIPDLRRRRARYGASDCRVYGASKGGAAENGLARASR